MLNNVTSFTETKDLFDAGFPQPRPEFGQVWYTKSGVEVVIGGHRFGTEYYAMLCGGQPTVVEKRNIVFAPTAKDIIKEFKLRFGGNLEMEVDDSLGNWTVADGTESLVGDNGWAVSATHENPANAAAKCFLSNPRKRGEKKQE